MAVSDFQTAFAGAQVGRALLRDALVRRTIYPFAPDEDPAAWTANVGGAVPLAIGFEAGGIYFLDAADGSTPADGISVIRSLDNYCYKISNMTMPDSALAPLGKVEPDGDEDIGDAYIVNDAPDGEFATFGGKMAVNTIRGWLPITPRIGRPVLVENDRHYFKDFDGVWKATFAPLSGGVRDADIIGGPRRYIVQNQTTNAPPAATYDTYYIIGPSPTGAWAGQAGKVAVYYTGDSAWTIIQPRTGDEAFDISLRSNYHFFSSIWNSAGGAVLKWSAPIVTQTTANTALNQGTATVYTFSTGTPPDTTKNHAIDNNGVTHAARITGAWLRIYYSARIAAPSGNQNRTWALAVLRDNEQPAIAWKSVAWGSMRQVQASDFFDFQANDAASHTYKMAFFESEGSANQIATLDCRSISIMERST